MMALDDLFKKVEFPSTIEIEQPEEEVRAVDEVVIKKEQTVAEILAEHNGLESNIGINHPYWKMKH